MKFKIVCTECGAGFWIHGVEEHDVNAIVLNDDDKEWDNVCEHIKESGDYDLTSEVEYEHWEDNVI